MEDLIRHREGSELAHLVARSRTSEVVSSGRWAVGSGRWAVGGGRRLRRDLILDRHVNLFVGKQ